MTTMIACEARNVSITMVKVWIERPPEIIKGYLPEDILNIYELELFFRELPQIGLVEKVKKNLEVKSKVKNDAPSDCLWLLMVLRFVMLLCYGDPESIIYIYIYIYIYKYIYIYFMRHTQNSVCYQKFWTFPTLH